MLDRGRNGHRQQVGALTADRLYCNLLYEIELNCVDSTIGSGLTH